MKTIGERLIFLMENKDMKQKELADRIGISKQSLYKYTHDLCEPRGEIIAKMAIVLETSADFIVGLTEDFSYSRSNITKESAVLFPSPKNVLEIEKKAHKLNILINKLKKLSSENFNKIEERIDFLLEMQDN